MVPAKMLQWMLGSFAALALASLAMAQGPGRGISKSTYAASDPTHTSYPWMMKYLPVNDAADSCPNNICTCGACGRVELKVTTDPTNLTVSPGFGIHTVLAAGAYQSRSKASGNLSVADVEAIFDTKWAEAMKKGEATPWLDYNTAIYVQDLSVYTSAFKADNVQYLPVTLNDSHYKTTYPALYVHIPKTQVIFLIVAPTTGADTDAHWADGTAKHAGPVSFAGYGGKPPATEAGLAYPLHVSRSVSDIDEMTAFYDDVFEVKPTFTEQISSDGGTLISYTLYGATVSIVYVNRPEGSASTDGHSTKWFQDYLNQVESKYQTSYKSCWPIWGDNHYCYDSGLQSIDKVVAKYEANKGTRGYVYHPFRNPGGMGCNAYFGEPSGWQFQLDGFYANCPADAESFSPAYCTTACEKTSAPFM